MTFIRYLIFAFTSTILGLNLVHASEPRLTPLEEVRTNPTLIEHIVAVHGCSGIPASDNTDNMLLVFPCGDNPNEVSLESIVIVEFPSRESAAGLTQSDIDLSGYFSATFIGRVERRLIDGDNHSIIVISSVTNLAPHQP